MKKLKIMFEKEEFLLLLRVDVQKKKETKKGTRFWILDGLRVDGTTNKWWWRRLLTTMVGNNTTDCGVVNFMDTLAVG